MVAPEGAGADTFLQQDEERQQPAKVLVVPFLQQDDQPHHQGIEAGDETLHADAQGHEAQPPEDVAHGLHGLALPFGGPGRAHEVRGGSLGRRGRLSAAGLQQQHVFQTAHVHQGPGRDGQELGGVEGPRCPRWPRGMPLGYLAVQEPEVE